jgi:hypothetical protein
MTLTDNLTSGPIFTSALRKRMMIGAGIGLLVISFFIFGAGHEKAAWGDYWRVKPLLLTPFIGAIAGLCFDATERLRQIDGWSGRLFTILSYIGYVLGLWIGIVLGLNGTMWN